MSGQKKASIRQLMNKFINEAKTFELKLLDSIYRMIEDKKTFSSDEEKFEIFRREIMPYLPITSAKTPKKGSSRIVYKLNENQVLKVALNEAGFAQNGMEATIGMDESVSEVVAPVLDTSDVVDYNGFLWIVSQKVEPLTDDLVTRSWPDFSDLLRKAATTNEKITGIKGGGGRAGARAPSDEKTAVPGEETKVAIPRAAAEKLKGENEKAKLTAEAEKLLKSLDENFFEAFRNFTTKYRGATTADLLKPDSWGMVKGKLKLLDYGYTRRIAQDFYVSGQAIGTAKAKESMIARNQERIQNIKSTVADNIDVIENTKNIPPMVSLLLLVRGVVAGMPVNIETFEIGNPLKPLTETEKATAAEAIRSNQGKVERIIDMVTDSSLKNKLYDELDDVLLTTGSLGKKSQKESLIRRFILEYIKF